MDPIDAPEQPEPEQPEPEQLRPGLPRGRKASTTKARSKRAETPDEQALTLARRIVDLASDKRASDIVLLEIGGLTTLADYFVICSGTSERQLGAIVDGIAEGLRDEGIKPIGREGSSNAHWMLIDYGAVIVHVMAPPEREFYQLERLWADAPLLLRLQ
jgi:ribosome-associated protein